MKLSERLRRLEQRRTPEGMLPLVIEVPSGFAEREKVLADVDRRRRRGENLLVVLPGDDPMAILADAIGP